MRKYLVLVAMGLMACGGSNDSGNGGGGGDDDSSASSDYSALLDYATGGVILPALSNATDKADDLVVTIAELGTSPTVTSLESARNAWRAAREAFRGLDGFHFGPIDEEGIGARIDFAPASRDAIELLVQGSAPLDVGSQGGATKGFLGLEALLFTNDVVAFQGDGVAARRRDYTNAVAGEIKTSVHALADAWTGDDGVSHSIRDAGEPDSTYKSQRAALDELVGGVAYGLELVVGVRLALPLGRKSTGIPTASADPTSASDSAVADMVAALRTIQSLYRDRGFSTRIRAKSTVLDDRCVSQLDACINAVQAIPHPFFDAVTNATPAIQDAYDKCKVYKATWNTDATSALGATLRPSDNDGD